MASPGAGTAQTRANGPKPHILYILADDLGFADVGFRGSDIATPHLDALAATGARLDQFHTQPMCTPTRTAFLTGRYPLRCGLQTGVIPSGADYGLATDEFLLPEALKAAGYRTARVGKWHLGHGDRKFWPRRRGFDSFYGPLVGEIDPFTHQAHGATDWYRDDTLLVEDGYDTDLFGAEAVRLIGGHDPATPLFLYLAFTAPHTPYQAPQPWIERYAHIEDPSRRAYAAMISAMDDQIGKVVAALEARGMREDTLILFHSDNGGTRDKMFVGEGAVGGELPASNAPLRAGKGTLYEGGTRVVALANWPGHLAPGSAEGVLHVVDMMPTLAGLAGAALDRAKPLDGRDVWPALSTGAAGRDEMVYNVEPTQGALLAAAQAMAQDAGGWSGKATLYGWFPVINGAQQGPDGAPLVDLELSDVLSRLDLVAMGSFELRKDPASACCSMRSTSISARTPTGRRARPPSRRTRRSACTPSPPPIGPSSGTAPWSISTPADGSSTRRSASAPPPTGAAAPPRPSCPGAIRSSACAAPTRSAIAGRCAASSMPAGSTAAPT
ncbi:MAG: arylsulfatase [Amaricoccus sp.]|uniref:arylsulfatase B n=1 Tax=Amaricoccus sp. TaxID=1872485 RepID=UPI0039E47E64